MTFGILKIYYQITPFLDSAYTGAACVWKSFQGNGEHSQRKLGGALLSSGMGEDRVECLEFPGEQRVDPAGGGVRGGLYMLWEKGGGDIASEWSSVAQEQGADNLVAGEIPECLRAGTRCCPLAHSSFLIICSCTPSFSHVNPGAPDRGQGCSTLSSVPPRAYHGAWLTQCRMDGWMDSGRISPNHPLFYLYPLTFCLSAGSDASSSMKPLLTPPGPHCTSQEPQLHMSAESAQNPDYGALVFSIGAQT